MVEVAEDPQDWSDTDFYCSISLLLHFMISSSSDLITRVHNLSIEEAAKWASCLSVLLSGPPGFQTHLASSGFFKALSFICFYCSLKQTLSCCRRPQTGPWPVLPGSLDLDQHLIKHQRVSLSSLCCVCFCWLKKDDPFPIFDFSRNSFIVQGQNANVMLALACSVSDRSRGDYVSVYWEYWDSH